MEKDDVIRNYPEFIEELRNEFTGKKQGYVKIIKVGPKIFPYSVSPQIEVVLLDPEEQILCFRLATDPDFPDRKKAKWAIGDPLDVVKTTIDWANRMKEIKNDGTCASA